MFLTTENHRVNNETTGSEDAGTTLLLLTSELFSVSPAGLEKTIFWKKVLGFYRAMHFSAKRGIAIVYCLSVCPSVRLCV